MHASCEQCPHGAVSPAISGRAPQTRKCQGFIPIASGAPAATDEYVDVRTKRGKSRMLTDRRVQRRSPVPSASAVGVLIQPLSRFVATTALLVRKLLPHRILYNCSRLVVALGAGIRLGAYEIIAPLGAGGMGEVYRALDTN